MPNGSIREYLDESASLWSLVDSIEQHVRRQLASHTYAVATEKFFEYVKQLVDGTKRFFDSQLIVSEPGINPARLRLATIRGYWRLLHELIKPAGDAHSLTAPAALIEFAAEQIRGIPSLESALVVVSLSPRLMYHQTGHTGIAELGRQIEGMIPTATFPKQLGFVALPYSQGTGFFANLLLYHELGHFVFEELSSSSQALIDLDARLAAETDDAFKNRASNAGIRAFALQVIRSWTHEVFCDLFALHMIGPAFSFAFVDLLNLLDILGAPTTISFNESHPAPACRFREHLQALKTLGWWSLLDDVKAPQKETIERLASHGNDDYRLDLHGDLVKDELLVPAFLRVLPEISISAQALTSAISVPAEEFSSHRTPC